MGETRSGPFKKKHSSAGRMFGWNTIYGVPDGSEGKEIPYMTRIWIGGLRLHIFHRGDADPDCHDHPWDFWTFPLTSYVEEVVHLEEGKEPVVTSEVVKAFRWHFRPAEHTHRVVGRHGGDHMDSYHPKSMVPVVVGGKIVTIVYRGAQRRPWGFLKNRDGAWCWVAFRDYIYNGGKSAPCE